MRPLASPMEHDRLASAIVTLIQYPDAFSKEHILVDTKFNQFEWNWERLRNWTVDIFRRIYGTQLPNYVSDQIDDTIDFLESQRKGESNV